MNEIYISTDIETDGPIPGPNSMWSLGAAAFTADGEMHDTFGVNLEALWGASSDPKTLAWWVSQPIAYAAARANPQDVEWAMFAYVDWVEKLAEKHNAKPVFVGYPAGFDFLFVYWYMIRFVGRSPFSFSALDIKTYAAAMMKCEYRRAVKRNMPGKWFSTVQHNHTAVDDAIEQGYLFCNMLKENNAN